MQWKLTLNDLSNKMCSQQNWRFTKSLYVLRFLKRLEAQLFQNWWKKRGSWKSLLKKEENQNGRIGPEMGVLIMMLCWGFLEDYSRCSTGKNLDLSFLNKHVLQNNCLNKIWDDWHCNSFNIADSCNSCVNYSCK